MYVEHYLTLQMTVIELTSTGERLTLGLVRNVTNTPQVGQRANI